MMQINGATGRGKGAKELESELPKQTVSHCSPIACWRLMTFLSRQWSMKH